MVSEAAGVSAGASAGAAVVAAAGVSVFAGVPPPPPEQPTKERTTTAEIKICLSIQKCSHHVRSPLLGKKDNKNNFGGLQSSWPLCYFDAAPGCSSAWLECLLREQEVPSSNLGTPKNGNREWKCPLSVFFALGGTGQSHGTAEFPSFNPPNPNPGGPIQHQPEKNQGDP